VADQFEIYSEFNIRAFESSPGKWTAEIRKVDGSKAKCASDLANSAVFS
jgi:hypothetical protein